MICGVYKYNLYANGEPLTGNTVPSLLNKITTKVVVLLIYEGKIFKPFDDMYFVSESGDVYSAYKRGLLKQSIDIHGYPRVDIHGKHMKIHKLVYLTWNGEIPNGMQINHIDDDKENKHYTNLYLGTQKENIKDCFDNDHRVGNIQTVLVYDKFANRQILFPSVKEFLNYTGHHIQSGSLSNCKKRKWFKNRFEIIEQKGVSTIENYKSIRAAYGSGVENKADIPHEVSRVEPSLSRLEAQGGCSK